MRSQEEKTAESSKEETFHCLITGDTFPMTATKVLTLPCCRQKTSYAATSRWIIDLYPQRGKATCCPFCRKEYLPITQDTAKLFIELLNPNHPAIQTLRPLANSLPPLYGRDIVSQLEGRYINPDHPINIATSSLEKKALPEVTTQEEIEPNLLTLANTVYTDWRSNLSAKCLESLLPEVEAYIRDKLEKSTDSAAHPPPAPDKIITPWFLCFHEKKEQLTEGLVDQVEFLFAPANNIAHFFEPQKSEIQALKQEAEKLIADTKQQITENKAEKTPLERSLKDLENHMAVLIFLEKISPGTEGGMNHESIKKELRTLLSTPSQTALRTLGRYFFPLVEEFINHASVEKTEEQQNLLDLMSLFSPHPPRPEEIIFFIKIIIEKIRSEATKAIDVFTQNIGDLFVYAAQISILEKMLLNENQDSKTTEWLKKKLNALKISYLKMLGEALMKRIVSLQAQPSTAKENALKISYLKMLGEALMKRIVFLQAQLSTAKENEIKKIKEELNTALKENIPLQPSDWSRIAALLAPTREEMSTIRELLNEAGERLDNFQSPLFNGSSSESTRLTTASNSPPSSSPSPG